MAMRISMQFVLVFVVVIALAYMNSQGTLTNENLVIGIGLIVAMFLWGMLEPPDVDMKEAMYLSEKLVKQLQEENRIEHGEVQVLHARLFSYIFQDQEKSVLGSKTVSWLKPHIWKVSLRIDGRKTYYYLVELDVKGRYMGKNPIPEGKLKDFLKEPDVIVIGAAQAESSIKGERKDA